MGVHPVMLPGRGMPEPQQIHPTTAGSITSQVRANKYLPFTTSATSDNGSAAWGASLADTNSTTFGISSANAVEASKDCIAYCFAPVVGYSSFGSYVGNGSSDGALCVYRI
jgi:hypothetical protein